MSELTPSLCKNCGHEEKHHHDGSGAWAKGCNQPLAMEVECPCKSFSPSPPYDLEGAAKKFWESQFHEVKRIADRGSILEFAASFAAERIADAVPKWVRVDESLPKENGLYLIQVEFADGDIRPATSGWDFSAGWAIEVRWKHFPKEGELKAKIIAWMPIPEYKPQKDSQSLPEQSE
jgi:hypothetical protein